MNDSAVLFKPLVQKESNKTRLALIFFFLLAIKTDRQNNRVVKQPLFEVIFLSKCLPQFNHNVYSAETHFPY